MSLHYPAHGPTIFTDTDPRVLAVEEAGIQAPFAKLHTVAEAVLSTCGVPIPIPIDQWGDSEVKPDDEEDPDDIIRFLATPLFPTVIDEVPSYTILSQALCHQGDWMRESVDSIGFANLDHVGNVIQTYTIENDSDPYDLHGNELGPEDIAVLQSHLFAMFSYLAANYPVHTHDLDDYPMKCRGDLHAAFNMFELLYDMSNPEEFSQRN